MRKMTRGMYPHPIQGFDLFARRFTNHLASPLCVEEFDLSDKNFRPCPCGYQVRALFGIPLTQSVLILNFHLRSASFASITSRTI
jgi:hypothetical protein